MQQEAREASIFLGEEVDGVLADRVEGAGQNTSGTTRQKLTEQAETTRGRLLLKALEQHHERLVWSSAGGKGTSTQQLFCLLSPAPISQCPTLSLLRHLQPCFASQVLLVHHAWGSKLLDKQGWTDMEMQW